MIAVDDSIVVSSIHGPIYISQLVSLGGSCRCRQAHDHALVQHLECDFKVVESRMS